MTGTPVNLALALSVIMGLSKLSESIGFPKKFIPILNLMFGIAFGVVYVMPNDVKLGVFNGVIMGLSASGLYSGVKNTVQGVRTAARKKKRVIDGL